MKKCLAFLTILSLMSFIATAQFKVLTLITDDSLVANSPFHMIEVIDNRKDTTLGIIQKGINKYTTLVLSKPMKPAMTEFFDFMIHDVTAGKDTLVMCVRKFFIVESGGGEHAYLRIRVNFFAKEKNLYRPLLLLDSTYEISGLEVTSRLLRTVSQQMTEIFHTAIQFSPSQAVYHSPVSLSYIRNIDEEEKKLLPLYVVERPKIGVYFSYSALKNNTPSIAEFSEYSESGNVAFFIRNEKGKNVSVDYKKVYAICDSESVMIKYRNQLCDAEKENNSYYFKGKINSLKDIPYQEMLYAVIFFGVMGAIAIHKKETRICKFMIDHLNGDFEIVE